MHVLISSACLCRCRLRTWGHTMAPLSSAKRRHGSKCLVRDVNEAKGAQQTLMASQLPCLECVANHSGSGSTSASRTVLDPLGEQRCFVAKPPKAEQSGLSCFSRQTRNSHPWRQGGKARHGWRGAREQRPWHYTWFSRPCRRQSPSARLCPRR